MDTDPREGNTKFCGRYFGVGTNKAAADVVSRCSKKYLIKNYLPTNTSNLPGTVPEIYLYINKFFQILWKSKHHILVTFS